MSMDYNGKRILVLTNSGEAIEVTIISKKTNKSRAQKIIGIGKVPGQMKALTVLN